MTDNSSIDLSLTNIWIAWRRFRFGKKPSIDIIRFESNLELELLRLCKHLNSNTYKHGSYKHRIVHEKKRRDIAVASVRDRVVHRLLYDYLVTTCDRRFDYDVWSCRLGKGTVAALTRTKELLRKYPTAYVWRADITKFFDNVDHCILRKALARYKQGDSAKKLLDEVIDSYQSGLQTDRQTDRQVCLLAI